VTDASDFIVDLNGYFALPESPGALLFYPMAPCRALDPPNSGGGSWTQIPRGNSHFLHRHAGFLVRSGLRGQCHRAAKWRPRVPDAVARRRVKAYGCRR